jgi:hypothetical protein
MNYDIQCYINMYINKKYTIVARRFVYELCKEKDLDYSEIRKNLLDIPESCELVVVKNYKNNMQEDRYQNIYSKNDILIGFYDELGEVFVD